MESTSKEFIVTITPHIEKYVHIEAINEEDAIIKLKQMWKKGIDYTKDDKDGLMDVLDITASIKEGTHGQNKLIKEDWRDI